MQLRAIGFWETTSAGGLMGWPHPSRLVAPGWEVLRRNRIVEYLRGGVTLAQYYGFSCCRFEQCPGPVTGMGTRDLTDGSWVWPEALWHYVADHDVRLPDEFVGHAATRNFVVAATVTQPISIDQGWWLRWVAANTAPPPPAPGACTLEDAQAICAELATGCWQATVASDCGRWKIRQVGDIDVPEDFTGPIPRAALCEYLFRTRRPGPDAVLEVPAALAIASEFQIGNHAMQPFATRTASDGRLWWAIVSSGPKPPKRPLPELDFESLTKPEPGWALFTPEGWRVDTVAGMDEPAWRFYLSQWRARIDAAPAVPAATEKTSLLASSLASPAWSAQNEGSTWRRWWRRMLGRYESSG